MGPHGQVRYCSDVKIPRHDVVVVKHGVVVVKAPEEKLNERARAFFVVVADDGKSLVSVDVEIDVDRLHFVALVSYRFLFSVVHALGRIFRQILREASGALALLRVFDRLAGPFRCLEICSTWPVWRKTKGCWFAALWVESTLPHLLPLLFLFSLLLERVKYGLEDLLSVLILKIFEKFHELVDGGRIVKENRASAELNIAVHERVAYSGGA